jgi:hypothetical protein
LAAQGLAAATTIGPAAAAIYAPVKPRVIVNRPAEVSDATRGFRAKRMIRLPI